MTTNRYTYAQHLDPRKTYFRTKNKKSRPAKIMRVGEDIYRQAVVPKEVPRPDASGEYIWVRWEDGFTSCYHSYHSFEIAL